MNDKNNDWYPIKYNMEKARKIWVAVKIILIRDKSTMRTMGYYYKVVIQSILLYGSESWVYMECMLRKLRNVHNKIARYLTRTHIRPDPDEEVEWIYPDMNIYNTTYHRFHLFHIHL